MAWKVRGTRDDISVRGQSVRGSKATRPEFHGGGRREVRRCGAGGVFCAAPYHDTVAPARQPLEEVNCEHGCKDIRTYVTWVLWVEEACPDAVCWCAKEREAWRGAIELQWYPPQGQRQRRSP